MTLLLKREAAPQTIGFEATVGEGPGAAQIGGRLYRETDRGVSVDLSLDNVDAQDFEPLLPRALPFKATSPIGGRAAMKVAANGDIETVSLDLTVGPGQFGPAGGDDLQVDEMTIAADWNRRSGRLTIHPSTLVAGENRGTLSGEIVVPHRGDFGYGTWPVKLKLTNVRLADPEADWPARFPLVSVEAFYVRAQNILNITRFDIASPEAAASMVGMLGGGRESPGIRLAGSSAPVPVRALKNLWPPFLGTGARNWVVKNIRDGIVSKARLTVDIHPEEIASALRGKPLPERAYELAFDLKDVTFGYLGDMPPVEGASATATLSPGAFDLRLTKPAKVHVGRGEIAVTDGRFNVGDLRPKPAVGEISLSLAGDADAVSELLNYEPLALAARRGINPSNIHGTADVDVTLKMPLTADVRFADVEVSADGTIKNLSADGLIEDRKVTDGDVKIQVADNWVTIDGSAKIDGVPADLSMRQPLDEDRGGGARTVTMKLDEAARKRMGLDLGGLLSGPVEATVSDIAATEKGASQRIEVDLTKARLHLAQLGLDKPAGTPAKASFDLTQDGKAVSVDDLVLTASHMRIEGKVEVDRDGSLVNLSLPVFRLPNGTDLSVSGHSSGGRRVFTLKGDTLDITPALDGFSPSGGGDASAPQPAEVEFDVRKALGRNGMVLSDLIGSLSVGSGGVRSADLSGIIGAGASVNVAYSTNSSPALSVRSGDAGAVFSFLGIYPNMRGGTLSVVANWQGPADALVGRLGVDDFSISDDPAVKRLIATGDDQQKSVRPDAPVSARTRSDSALVDPGDVRLDRMEAQFALAGGRLDVRNGVIRGAAVGATVEGSIALRTRRLDLHGTYVPLYAINNLFQRVPVFGALLGGKRNEGLLGITYSLRGGFASPDLTVNPLSVVAPGVFRYILGMDNPRAFDAPSRSGGAPLR